MMIHSIKHQAMIWLASLIKSDSQYLKIMYFLKTGRKLNLEMPEYFSEKIQWLKLNDKHPEYTTMVDKADVKDYVANIIGKEYIIPTIAIYERPEDIDFNNLPRQFVLKCTHDSGGIVICRNKELLDVDEAKKTLYQAFNQKFSAITREYPYHGIKPRIIAEEYKEQTARDNGGVNSDLMDYKFYCFDGNPIYCQVIRDRTSVETIDFYDMDWKLQSFIGLNPKATNGKEPVSKPCCLDGMINICKKLSKGIRFVRVDLYVINGKIYFGELTFFPASGFGVFRPEEWNKKLGDLIKI